MHFLQKDDPETANSADLTSLR